MSFIQEHQEVLHGANFWRKILRLWLYVTTFGLPIIILPFTRDMVNLPKSLFLYVTVIVGVLLWGIMLVLSEETVIRRTIIDPILLVLAGGSLVSAIFSKAMSLSMIGRVDAFTFSLFFLLSCVLWVWLIIQSCDSQQHVERFIQVLLGSVAVTILGFFLRESNLLAAILQQGVIQPVSAVNSVFALVVAVIGVASVGLFLIKGRIWYQHILPGLLSVMSLAVLLHTNFRVAWIIYLVGLGALVLCSVVLAKHTTVTRASLAFVFFLIGIAAILFPLPQKMQATLPVEVALGAQASWDISRQAWLSNVKTFFIGSGPGTFTVDFSRYRTALFNIDPLVWTTRFTLPFNSFFALLSEVGLFGVLPFLFIILIVLGNVGSALRRVYHAFSTSPAELAKACGPEYMMPFSIFSAWLAATVALALVYADVTLWIVWWLLLAVLLITLSRIVTGVIKRKDISLRISSQYTLAFSFGMILVVFGILIFGTLGYKLYAAEIAFTNVVQTRNVDEQGQQLARALQKRPQYAEYQLGRARLHVESARAAAATDSPDVTLIADELSQAVERVKQVTAAHPHAIDAWELLGVIYMNTRSITPEANDWALEAIEKAIVLEPSNPLLYWRRANVEAYAGDMSAAEMSYIRAIELKPDYIIAYMDLSALYEQQSDLDKAIAVYQPIMSVVEDNAELLFQLGKLFYNRNVEEDLNRAEQVWTRAIAVAPEHSNTLYSLGLLHERRGNRQEAREYFTKVQELNPGNADIQTKLRSL